MSNKLRQLAYVGYIMMVIPLVSYFIILIFYKGDIHIFDNWILLVSSVGVIILGVSIFISARIEIKGILKK